MITNVPAVAVATLAAFLLGAAWYVGFGRTLARLSPVYADATATPAWHALLEVVRCLVLAVVLAVLCGWIEVDGAAEALRLAVMLWAGFPAVLLAGSVLHERVPWRLAAVHAGDWLLKLVVVTLIVGLWR